MDLLTNIINIIKWKHKIEDQCPGCISCKEKGGHTIISMDTIRESLAQHYVEWVANAKSAGDLLVQHSHTVAPWASQGRAYTSDICTKELTASPQNVRKKRPFVGLQGGLAGASKDALLCNNHDTFWIMYNYSSWYPKPFRQWDHHHHHHHHRHHHHHHLWTDRLARISGSSLRASILAKTWMERCHNTLLP